MDGWYVCLVGGWYTPLKKYDFVTWDFLKFPSELKNI